jgi:hypothetical protein
MAIHLFFLTMEAFNLERLFLGGLLPELQKQVSA